MRRTYRKGNFKELNKHIIIIGVVFIAFIILGTYLNKIWPSSQTSIIENINPSVEYYNSKSGTTEAVISNLKSDTMFMASISICTLLVVTFPIVVIIFMLKGLSMGYTINSTILALKFESMKMIFIILFKNIVIIPGAIILALISLNY
ncbi:MAG: stage II sporulation protein M, partial [Romboutsia sp.]|uniref:stage II sporulation protein M n=1 Tax=Romboutsia sp. TaxID=1965302 RepID=UPI003F38050C